MPSFKVPVDITYGNFSLL